jgi:aminopeptidase
MDHEQTSADAASADAASTDAASADAASADALLERYARHLVEEGVGLRSGQELYLRGRLEHRELAHRIGEAAYDLGARQVHYRFTDPVEASQLIRRSRPEQIELHHLETRGWYLEVARSGSAAILLTGNVDPRELTALAREHLRNLATFSRAASEAAITFNRYAVDRRLFPCSVAVAPTAPWARRLYPELAEKEAERRFCHLLLRASGAGVRDFHRRLEARRRVLDALRIREIRVLGGGNDLRVGLSPLARWLGGKLVTHAGQPFYPNVPTAELFTTPDRRLTRGRLVASRPFRIGSGARISGLVLHFEGGRVVDFDAEEGTEPFTRWLDLDEGARRLGELALVDVDSPLARTGLHFDHPILDENATCHLALGRGYTLGLADGERLSTAELERAGHNASIIHTDVPFGSPEVTVVATRTGEGKVVLLEGGRWTDPTDRVWFGRLSSVAGDRISEE